MKLTSSVSLSFLDLLTCCLGAMLLLFFVIVLLREDAGSNSGGGRGGDAEDATDSFVLIAAERIDDDEVGQPDQGRRWSLREQGKEIDSNENIYSSVAPRYALFYATAPLPKGVELRLESQGGQAAWRFTVHEGRDHKARSAEFEGHGDSPIYVWP